MPSTTTIYNPLRKYLLNGTIDLDTDPIYVALVANTYTVDAAHAAWADVSTHEVAAGDGYTAGGQLLLNPVSNFAAAVGSWITDNPVWPALTKTFRYAVLYADVVRNSVTDPLICCILINNTPADIVVSAADYSLQWHPSGILTLSS
jgi:hypothetical protein